MTTGVLQLTEQLNPMAQTFRVTERNGSVLTAIGLYFQSAPAVSDDQLPITIELRPVTESGSPSGRRFISGTRVSASAAQIRAVASTTFGSGTEYKFTFDQPLYVPGNVELALVAYTNAKVGQYKVWAGKIGEHQYGSTTELVSQQLASGVFFQSSNGTAWSKDQEMDIAFKVYRAVFDTSVTSTAYMNTNLPPRKSLTENLYTDAITKYPTDPLIFTKDNSKVRVIHPGHGFIIGDKVKLSSDSAGYDSADTINGIPGSELLRTHTIDSADPFGYTISVTSTADSSLREGGTNIYATEQYIIDDFVLSAPNVIPTGSSLSFNGDFTTSKSFAGTETAYATTANVALNLNKPTKFRNPHVIASKAQEDDAAKLNGDPSTVIRAVFNTTDQYVAPSFDLPTTNLKTLANFIDYPQSDDSSATNRNNITTIDYVAETEPDGGTNASKHITIPFQLEEAATSIRVYIDAIRPVGSDFSVWYRTLNTSTSGVILDQNWVEFSKTINPPNSSNYLQIGETDMYRQFEFNVYDLPDFDTYQLKITMNSTNSSSVPEFKNLRTIATV